MKTIKLIVFVIGLSLFIACSDTIQKETFNKGECKEWAKTPPMSWNSWDCYGQTVEEYDVKANADYMASHLKPYGWESIVVDIRWFVETLNGIEIFFYPSQFLGLKNQLNTYHLLTVLA